jgi:hypothetical protein
MPSSRAVRPLAFASLFVPAAALALGLSARPAEPQEGDLTPRIAALEQALAAQTQRLELADQERQQMLAKVSALEACLTGQAKSIDELVASLGRVESQGFTAGINPKSREELLAGLRSYLGAQKEALGKLESKPKASAPSGRVAPR